MRSVPWALAPLRRALAAAGVPTTTAATELPLARQRGAAWLLLVLRAVTAAFDTEDALALLAGPLGAADPVALRRLRRGSAPRRSRTRLRGDATRGDRR